jgi:hypothetical protein
MNELAALDSNDSIFTASSNRIVFVAAMGFEDRALEFPKQLAARSAGGLVITIRYVHAKGENREREFQMLFSRNSAWQVREVKYSSIRAHEFEGAFDSILNSAAVSETDTVVVDISGMSKFLILVTLLRLWRVKKTLKLVMTTALKYTPTKVDFDATMHDQGTNIRAFAGQPSSGVSAILRSNCMTSIRMQGQPTCAVAFTSFNEELIRHAIGTLNPRRLILINGMPPLEETYWRSAATQLIHSNLVEEYAADNHVSEETGLLLRTVSTLDYLETLQKLEDIHREFGLYERMIYFATGSKMQTVALAIHRQLHRDAHLEYPTPDSYFFQEYSKGVGTTFGVEIDC